MKTFNGFLVEAKEKGAVFTFGRFNPPTTGHAKLVDKLKKESRGDDVLLFTSHSNDKQKNPLNHRDKIKYLRNFFGKIVADVNARTVFEIATELHKKKYTRIKMVVGSDRVREFDTLLNKYNGVKARHGFYKFDEINIVSVNVTLMQMMSVECLQVNSEDMQKQVTLIISNKVFLQRIKD